jgi:arginase
MAEEANEQLALTVFSARAGDMRGHGVAGAIVVGEEIASRFGIDAVRIDDPPGAWDGDPTPFEGSLPSLGLLAQRYGEILAAGRSPVTSFSRCPTALASLPAVAHHRPDAAVLWLDAHPDLNTPASSATGYFGGLALAGPLGLWDSGLGDSLRPGNVIFVGARDIDPPEREVIERAGMPVIGPGPGIAERLDEAIGDRPVFVHFDCDMLEPGIVPLDYEVPGGLDLEDVRAVAEVAAKRKVIGLEIGEFEVDPEADGPPSSPAALLDALDPLLRGAASR